MSNGNGSRCSGWCAPFYIYLVLIVISTLSSWVAMVQYDNVQNDGVHQFMLSIVHLLFSLLWAMLIYWLCSRCWNGAAWAVLLFPIIVIGFLILFLLVAIINSKNNRRTVQYNNLPNADYWSPVH